MLKEKEREIERDKTEETDEERERVLSCAGSLPKCMS